MDGIYVTSAKYSDNNPPNGFLQDAVWLIFDNGYFLEAGMFEPTTNATKFVTAVNGVIRGTSSHSPIDGNTYVLAVYDSNADNKFTMKADSQITTKYMAPPAKPYAAKVGVEAQFTNASDNATDFDGIHMHHGGSWKKLSTSNAYQGYTEKGTGWDVVTCGSGNESMYHINAGKGTISC